MLCEELEDTRGIAHSLEVFAGLLAAVGFAEAAARLWGAAEGGLANVGGSLAASIRWNEIAISREQIFAGELVRGARTEGRTKQTCRLRLRVNTNQVSQKVL